MKFNLIWTQYFLNINQLFQIYSWYAKIID